MKTASTAAMRAGRIAAVGSGLVLMVVLLVLLPPRPAHADTFTVEGFVVGTRTRRAPLKPKT